MTMNLFLCTLMHMLVASSSFASLQFPPPLFFLHLFSTLLLIAVNSTLPVLVVLLLTKVSPQFLHIIGFFFLFPNHYSPPPPPPPPCSPRSWQEHYVSSSSSFFSISFTNRPYLTVILL